jgi:hypothetical protein
MLKDNSAEIYAQFHTYSDTQEFVGIDSVWLHAVG